MTILNLHVNIPSSPYLSACIVRKRKRNKNAHFNNDDWVQIKSSTISQIEREKNRVKHYVIS